MSDATPPPNGVHCPACRGGKLVVTATRKPVPGVTVQYRRCASCDERVVTEVRVSRTRRPRGKVLCQTLARTCDSGGNPAPRRPGVGKDAPHPAEAAP